MNGQQWMTRNVFSTFSSRVRTKVCWRFQIFLHISDDLSSEDELQKAALSLVNK